VQNATEDAFGTIFGVDNQRNQLAGALNQSRLSANRFATANRAADLRVKNRDFRNFDDAFTQLQELAASGDRSASRMIQAMQVTPNNPNLQSTAQQTQRNFDLKEIGIDRLRQAIAGGVPGADRDLLAVLTGKTLNDAAISDIARNKDQRTVEGLEGLESTRIPVPGGGEVSLSDIIKSGGGGGDISALGLLDPKRQKIGAEIDLTRGKRLTETYKQNNLNIRTEVAQSVLDLNDEELEFMRANNPQKLQKAEAEIDLAEEKVQEQLQKTTNQAERLNLIQAMTQTQEARRRFIDKKSVSVGDSGLEPKDYLKEVDKAVRVMLGAIPNNPEFGAMTIQTPQAFTDANGVRVKKGEFVEATRMPTELVRSIAERQVQRSTQQSGQEPSSDLVDLLTPPEQVVETGAEPREPSLLENVFGIPTTGQEETAIPQVPFADFSAVDPTKIDDGKQEIFNRLNISEPPTAQHISMLRSNMNNPQVPAETRELIRQILLELGQ